MALLVLVMRILILIPIEYLGLDDIPMQEVSDLYKAANNSIYEQYLDFPYQNKYVICVDLVVEATTNGNNLLVLTSMATKVSQKSGTLGNDVVFGYEDYWSLTSNKCNGYEDQAFWEQNATSALEAKVILNKHTIPRYVFWSKVETTSLINPQNYPNTMTSDAEFNYKQKQYNESGIWTPNFHICYTPEEMNFHYNGIIILLMIEDLIPKQSLSESLCKVWKAISWA